MAPNTPTQQAWSLKMTVPLEPGIVCADIDAMLEFYIGVLGLKLVGDAKTTPELSARFGATPHGYRIVRLQTPYGERIKLVQPNRDAPPPQPVPGWVYERHGLAYLTFVIADMQDVVKRLKTYGVKLLSDGAIEVRPGVFALYSLDPEGNFVEFVEYPDPPAYRPDLFKWRQF
jgi:catechol 2,3-dioxygenase-like lactoylglutathione lyase family enzyme